MSGDGDGGIDVIAGDHLHLDTSSATGCHRLDRFKARRIEHSLQAKKCQSLGYVAMIYAALIQGALTPCESQNPKTLTRQFANFLVNDIHVQWHAVQIGIEGGIAAIQEALHRTFEIDMMSVLGLVVMQGGHELIGRFEGDGIQAWMALLNRIAMQPGLVGRHQQRAFGWIALDAPAFHLRHQSGIVAQQTRFQRFQ